MTWHDRSGSRADSGATAIFTIRRGRIRVAEFFWDHAEALETVGLLEQDISSA
jgi:ketosteroid isomerase-like protein